MIKLTSHNVYGLHAQTNITYAQASAYPLPPTDTIRLDIAGRKFHRAILILNLNHPLYDMWSKWPSPLMFAIAFLKASFKV